MLKQDFDDDKRSHESHLEANMKTMCCSV